jgi:uncharacterized phage-associated protein
MPSAEAVARYFLWLAGREPGEEPVTHLRLQKLLYYAQGWALGSRGTALFESALEAWPHGPVVRDVYGQFARHERDPIPSEEGRDDENLSARDKGLVEWVWGHYGKHSASELWRMTHAEPPWLQARKGLPNDSKAKPPIDDGLVREFFGSLHRDVCKRAGLDPDLLAAAMEEARQGKGIPLADAIAEMNSGMGH